MSKRGITLIEMVAVIVVLGISIPVLLTMWSDVAWRSARSEVIADAAFYAQALMEEIKMKAFDENDSSPWSSSLGTEAGESYADYDDVDDFNGYSDSPEARYSRSVAVEYVRLNASDIWESCGTVSSCASSPDCVNCNGCCYKRITVNVSRTDNLVDNVTLVTMRAGF